MTAVITRLLDEWAPKGAFDFEEFASYFPITVFCGMVGASPDLVPGIRKSMEAIGQGFSLARPLPLAEAVGMARRGNIGSVGVSIVPGL